eukprot:m.319056 g.319056  ORF g.319056 m.319056 type:complete len:65 (-) comp20297_c0_seq4:669-863(-)
MTGDVVVAPSQPGGKALSDLDLVHRLSNGRVDLTFGSALDIFGGSGVKYADCVAYNAAAMRTIT